MQDDITKNSSQDKNKSKEKNENAESESSDNSAVLDLVGQRQRLINEKKVKQAADLKMRFQKAMGWDQKKEKKKPGKAKKNKDKR